MFTTLVDPEIDSRLEVLHPLIKQDKSFVAGGCFKDLLTDKVPRDIDVYFYNAESYDEMLHKFTQSTSYSLKYSSHNAIAFKHIPSGMKVELINRKFGTPTEIINGFDFTVVQIALYQYNDNLVNHNSHMLVCNSDFFSHLSEKKLYITEQLRSNIMDAAGHALLDADAELDALIAQHKSTLSGDSVLSLSGDKLFNRILKYTTIHGYSLDLSAKYLLFHSIRSLTNTQIQFLSEPTNPNY